MIYGLGAKMGFTPRQVDGMTTWELMACADGFAEFHGAKPKPDGWRDEDIEAFRGLGIVGFDDG